MQQRPVRQPPRHTSRGARAAIALCAAVAALPFGGRLIPGPSAPQRHVTQTSNGMVATLLTPALPRRTRPVIAPVAAPAVAPGFVTTPEAAATELPPLATTARQRLAIGAPGTYIGELLRIRDSANLRWPERVDRPLTVWVGNAAGVADWHPAYIDRVAEAFAEWTQTGVPVRFRFVQDSGAAEVHVAWTDRFREPYSGRTVWSRDDKWWITDANITLALHHNDGRPLDEDQVHAIALHEIGHLLGLDHTSDPTNVMAARVRVRDISSADQATARLVYSLPAGHL